MTVPYEFAFCPELVDDDYGHTVPCGQPATVVGRFTLQTTSGPLVHVLLECVCGHGLTPTEDQIVFMP